METVLGWFRDLCTAARELRLEQDEPSPSPAPRQPSRPAPEPRAAAVALVPPKVRPYFHRMSDSVRRRVIDLRHCFRCGSKDHMVDGCTAAQPGCALCGGEHKADDCPQPPAPKNE